MIIEGCPEKVNREFKHCNHKNGFIVLTFLQCSEIHFYSLKPKFML